MEGLVIFIAIYIIIAILYLDLQISSMRVLYEEKVVEYRSRVYSKKTAESLSKSVVFDARKILKMLFFSLVPGINVYYYLFDLVDMAVSNDIFSYGSNKDTALVTVIKRKKSLHYILFRSTVWPKQKKQ